MTATAGFVLNVVGALFGFMWYIIDLKAEKYGWATFWGVLVAANVVCAVYWYTLL